MILAVTLLDIRNNPTAIDIIKVDINIRHGYAFGIEESLKEERIAQRVNIRDPQQIGDNTARRRTAPGADFYTVPTRIIDKVPDNQKVAGIAHAVNHAQLIVQTRANLVRNIRIA